MLNMHRTPESATSANPMNKLKQFIRTNTSTIMTGENSIVGTESIGDTQWQELNSHHDNLISMLSTGVEGIGNEAADAMAQALMVVADNAKLKDAMVTHLGEDVGNESFDSDSVVNNLCLTVGVAGTVAATDSDADFLFPKVVVDQKTTNYKIKAVRTVIEPKFYHAQGGAVTDWGKMNLLDAAVKENMLRKDMNVFVPEIANGNESYFVSDSFVTPWDVTRADGKVVSTSFLSADAGDVNLIGVSTAKGMERNTNATILDRIDEGAKIAGLVLSIGAAVDGNAIYLNTLSANHSTFTKSQTESENNIREVAFGKTTMMVNLANYVAPAKGGFKDIADIPALKALTDAQVVKLGFKVANSYSLDLSEGTFTTTKAAPVITYLEEAGAPGVNALESFQAANAALVAAVQAAFIATDFQGTLSNATLKLSGDQIGSQNLDKLYPLNVKNPVEIRKDVLSKLDDAEAIKMLSQALLFRRDDETVSDLDKWFQWAVVNLGHEGVADSLRNDLDIIGLHYLLKPYVKEVQVNLSELLKEEDTTSKLDVLEVGMVTKLQDEMVQAVQESNYRSVLRTHGSDNNAVPEFGIYGDSRVTSYLMRTGEERTLGDGSTIQSKPAVHPTDRESMRDTLYVMPRVSSYSNEKDRVMGFGHSIEITPVVVKRARDNGVAHDQLQIWPVYTNIVTMPILLKFNIVGLDDYFAKASADVVVNP